MKNKVIEKTRSITPAFLLLFVWVGWHKYLLKLFDKCILPYLNLDTNLWTSVIFTIIIFAIIIRLTYCCINRYIISVQHLSYAILSLIIYLSVRFSGRYIYLPDWGIGVGYMDIIVFLGLCVIIISIIDFLRIMRSPNRNKKTGEEKKKDKELKKAGKGLQKKRSNKKQNIYVNNTALIISDVPIASAKDDLLDYSIDANNLADKINNISFENSLSIGITSIWGSGKSSYLNLLEESLDKSKYIIVKFNPRHSKDASFIQEDFFNALVNTLKDYNSDFSQLIKRYLNALNIFNDSSLVRFIFGIHSLHDKEDRKDKLETAIKRLPKRVVIFIEDFDRLMPDEIIEVFKLIDGNASFTNFLFISAYDKEHVNRVLEKELMNEESCFSDKFFTLEVPIPVRPYQKIFDYLIDTLSKQLNIPEKELPLYESVLRGYAKLLNKYLPTVRDVKRFLNMFLRDYEAIKDEVNFRDYFLLTLIKYKYPEEYRLLSKREYLTFNINTGSNSSLTENSKNAKSYDILEILFESSPPYRKDNSLTLIKNESFFDVYFYNYVHEGLSVKEMQSLFRETDISIVKMQLDNWIIEGTIEAFIGFLVYKNISAFEKREQFEQYVEIIFYLIRKHYNGNLYMYMYALVSNAVYDDEIKEKYGYENNDYKEFIKSKFANTFSIQYSHIIRQLILDSDPDFKDKFIFTTNEFLEINKSYLNTFLEQPNEEEDVIKLLYGCISNVEGKTRLIILDKEACEATRKYLIKYPNRYINEFVRLQGASSSPEHNGITGEPFWEQIFGGADEFEKFITDKTLDEVKNISQVRNFWEIYKNNGYEAISFENQGNVQKKIDTNLTTEVKQLKDIENLEIEYNSTKEAFKKSINANSNNKSIYGFYLNTYKKLLNRLDAIPLPIKRKGDLRLQLISSFNEMDVLSK